tara:strand:+ start:119 stop:481 length:363 start_codon:yes stop_codon:yes gene_type:complete
MTELQFIPNLTNHASTQSNKRNITNTDIKIIIDHGSFIHKQNRKFYFITSNNVPEGIILNSRISSIVVLTSLQGDIITCYYNKRPKKHISLKQKRFSKYKQNKTFLKVFSEDQRGILNVA